MTDERYRFAFVASGSRLASAAAVIADAFSTVCDIPAAAGRTSTVRVVSDVVVRIGVARVGVNRRRHGKSQGSGKSDGNLVFFISASGVDAIQETCRFLTSGRKNTQMPLSSKL